MGDGRWRGEAQAWQTRQGRRPPWRTSRPGVPLPSRPDSVAPGWRRALVRVIVAVVALGGNAAPAADWRSASREPTGAAPDPARVREAVVQVYAAPVWGWRGRFAVHTWIAVKPSDAAAYTVYEVIGWRKYRGEPPLAIHTRVPDARWFGAVPQVLFDRRGPDAERLIGRIDRAARSYPWADSYVIWPGPNSNTFTSYVIRAVPELAVELPPTAIGKDYLGVVPIARAPGGGLQISLLGVLGLLVGGWQGFEVNILGLVFGFDVAPPALKLPVLGRIPLRLALGSGDGKRNVTGKTAGTAAGTGMAVAPAFGMDQGDDAN
jgi:hypothetical protein